ncbi:hypothetical protein [Kistimonas asteriae]|nr:hypothetical protein [Kistimonas asteriae]
MKPDAWNSVGLFPGSLPDRHPLLAASQPFCTVIICFFGEMVRT